MPTRSSDSDGGGAAETQQGVAESDAKTATQKTESMVLPMGAKEAAEALRAYQQGIRSSPKVINPSSRVVSTGSASSLSSNSPKRQAKTLTKLAGIPAIETSEAAEVLGSIAGSSTVAKSDWPMTNIEMPHPNDVLCGRGGGTNSHAGNEAYRWLVKNMQLDYISSTKREKPLVSRSIVESIRRKNPPGRFLQKDTNTLLWYDIGDQKAREKTSQALREGAPNIRKGIGQVAICGAVGTYSGLSPKDALDTAVCGHHDEVEDGATNADNATAKTKSPSIATSDKAGEKAKQGEDDSDNSHHSATLSTARAAFESHKKSMPKKDTSKAPGSGFSASCASKMGSPKKPKSLGSGELHRGVSAPVTPGSYIPYGGPPPPPYYGGNPSTTSTSNRGRMRGVSVPQTFHHPPYPGPPPQYPRYPFPPQPPGSSGPTHPVPANARAVGPPAPVVAQWMAGGSNGSTNRNDGGLLPPNDAIHGSSFAAVHNGAVPDDIRRRLLLSEWIMGGKASGSTRSNSQEQRKLEEEAEAYRTAGLLGIDPGEITERLAGGKEDIFAIVKSFQKDKVANANETGAQQPHKRRRITVSDWTEDSSEKKSETRKRIEDALNSMGAF